MRKPTQRPLGPPTGQSGRQLRAGGQNDVASRILVLGSPRAGKTTRYPDAVHADDWNHLPWSECSAALAQLMLRPGPWTLEGVRLVHALRKALVLAPKPADLVICLWEPVLALTPAQARLRAGCLTVWQEIKPALVRAGVRISD